MSWSCLHDLGLIGAGNISATHLRAAQMVPGVVVSAVYSPTFEKARRLAEMAGAVAYGALEDFLVTQTARHRGDRQPVRHACRAGDRRGRTRTSRARREAARHLDCARVDAVIAAAERHGVRVGVFFQDRLKPDIVRVKQIVDEGRLGVPVLASGRVKWHRPPEYYARFELAWHARARRRRRADEPGDPYGRSAAVALRRRWPRCRRCVATRVHSIEVEDTAAAVLTFRNGAIGVIEAATSIFPGYSRRLELTGSEGTLIVEQDTLVATDLRSGRAAAVSAD